MKASKWAISGTLFGALLFPIFATAHSIAKSPSIFADLGPIVGSQEVESSSGGKYAARIMIRKDTIICTTVTTNQEMWGAIVDSDVRNGLSSVFINKLRDELYKKMPSALIPRKNFLADPDRRIPMCMNEGAVRIDARYDLNKYGKPFSLKVNLSYKDVTYHNEYQRDIENEWQSRRLKRLYKTDPMKAAIFSDIDIRARDIVGRNFLNLGD